jgi:phosphatidylserine/phosphatidylglycerophosphate/cardiolipin synthase-like enzyme
MKAYTVLIVLVLLVLAGCQTPGQIDSPNGSAEPPAGPVLDQPGYVNLSNFVWYNMSNISLDINLVTGSYFCPEDNCRQAVIDQLQKANTSIYIAMYSFTDKQVADVLIAKAKEGVDVRVFVELGQISKYSQAQRIYDAGIPIKEDTNSAYMHNKFVVIDGKILMTGSVNYTGNGFDENNENMVIISGIKIAQKYQAQFLKLWATGLDWVGG